MWPFKKSKPQHNQQFVCPPCPFCRSTRTGILSFQDSNQTDYVRVWRGERVVVCRCHDCGRDFYVPEPKGGIPPEAISPDDAIDEAELNRAEAELKRETDADGDHRFR